jgi:DNA-binding beta-propeller fold protein YncE
VTIDGQGRIYLVSEETGHIYVYDEDRNPLFQFGVKGGSSGKLSRPKAVAVDNRDGRMYVVDYMRHTINVYDREGEYMFEFGGKGWLPGWFSFPTTITVDPTGRVFVADLFNSRVQVFNPRLQTKKTDTIEAVKPQDTDFPDDLPDVTSLRMRGQDFMTTINLELLPMNRKTLN